MIFTLRFYKVCVPANTPCTSPVSETVELPKGVLNKIMILIPQGHMGYTGVRIKYGLEIILPYRQDTFLRGNGIVVTDETNFPLQYDPTTLTVEACNEDELYDHCFYLYFIVKKEEEIMQNILIYFLRKLRLWR